MRFPEDRPTFKELHESLNDMNKDENSYVNFGTIQQVILPPTSEEIIGKSFKRRSESDFNSDTGVQRYVENKEGSRQQYLKILSRSPMQGPLAH